MSQCDRSDCSPATPITETATLHVAVSSACGTELDRYKMEAKKRMWAPDDENVWEATSWKKLAPPKMVIPTMEERTMGDQPAASGTKGLTLTTISAVSRLVPPRTGEGDQHS